MRKGTFVHCLMAAAGAAGCGASTGTNPSATGGAPAAVALVGRGFNASVSAPIRALAAGAKISKGIYASEFDNGEILGYAGTNPRNKPPACTFTAGAYVNGIAVDGKGDLIVPVGSTRTIEIFKGPSMCGTKLASLSDPYGQPSDATSFDAQTGGIVVGNSFDGQSGSSPGSVSVCSVATGCGENLTDPNLNEVYGVAQAKNRDCWASGLHASSAVLIYFKGCDSAGRVAKHFLNENPGGLEIDKDGHILAISTFDSKLYVYRGCNPGCVLIGGPFSLHGEAIFGHLNAGSTTFATASFENSSIDVYSYNPAKLTYLHSFYNGLNGSYNVEGVAVAPRSRE